MPEQEKTAQLDKAPDLTINPKLEEIYDFYDVALQAVEGECRACPRALRAALRVSDDIERNEVTPDDYLEAYYRKLGKPCLEKPEICNLPENR